MGSEDADQVTNGNSGLLIQQPRKQIVVVSRARSTAPPALEAIRGRRARELTIPAGLDALAEALEEAPVPA